MTRRPLAQRSTRLRRLVHPPSRTIHNRKNELPAAVLRHLGQGFAVGLSLNFVHQISFDPK
jgi:hypothetical protein